MLNNLMLVGRLTADPVIKDKVLSVVVAVNRQFKNEEGIYETDLIPVILWNGVAEQVSEYCKKGDLIGIRGRIEENDGNIEIIAEKVTFLSSKPKEENDGNNK